MPAVMRSAMAGGIGMNVKIYLEHPNARGDQVGNGRGDWDESKNLPGASECQG